MDYDVKTENTTILKPTPFDWGSWLLTFAWRKFQPFSAWRMMVEGWWNPGRNMKNRCHYHVVQSLIEMSFKSQTCQTLMCHVVQCHGCHGCHPSTLGRSPHKFPKRLGWGMQIPQNEYQVMFNFWLKSFSKVKLWRPVGCWLCYVVQSLIEVPPKSQTLKMIQSDSMVHRKKAWDLKGFNKNSLTHMVWLSAPLWQCQCGNMHKKQLRDRAKCLNMSENLPTWSPKDANIRKTNGVCFSCIFLYFHVFQLCFQAAG